MGLTLNELLDRRNDTLTMRDLERMQARMIENQTLLALQRPRWFAR